MARYNEKQRRDMGCFGAIADKNVAVPFDGETFRECPVRTVLPRTRHAVQLAGLLESGAWPVAGGVLDQANAFVQAACVVTAAREAERQRKEKSRG
jgi:hypothetical protein